MPRRYAVCLADPFDPNAEGAQVPDMYAFPTATALCRQSFTAQTIDTSGNLDFVVQPNPLCTIACSSYNNASQSVITGGTPWFGTNNNPNSTGLNHGFSEFGVSSYTSLANTFTRYRVVGFGVRITSVLPSLTQQGQIFVAKVPALHQWAYYPNGGTDTAQAEWQQYLNYYELPPLDGSGFITTQMSQLQTFHENSVPNMTLNGGLEVVGQICSPVAFEWRDGSNATYISSDTTQCVMQTKAAGFTGIFYVDPDYVTQGGWSTMLFRASNLPPTAGTICFNVEIIMHLEGVPNLGTSIINGGAAPPVEMHLMQQAIHHAARLPPFRKIAHGISNAIGSFNRVSRAFGGPDAKSLLGTAALSMIAL